jgi:hypothetical protein
MFCILLNNLWISVVCSTMVCRTRVRRKNATSCFVAWLKRAHNCLYIHAYHIVHLNTFQTAMRKILSLIAIALFVGECVASQDTLLLQNSRTPNPHSPAPLIVVKGDEIRRFPGTNFMDAVNGLFPWVSSLSPDANEFLFVVNGFVLPDINSLSLNDIEEVTFVKNDLNGRLFPFSRAGTFYVTTRKHTGAKATINFNSQYNAVWQQNNRNGQNVTTSPVITSKQNFDNKAGHLLSNQSSLLAGGNKWELYLSAQLDQSAGPTNASTTISTNQLNRKDTSVYNARDRFLNVRSFAQFIYRSSATLEFGITGSYFHGDLQQNRTQADYNPTGSFTGAYRSKSVLPYYHGGAFINWQPLKNLSNRVSAEYANDELTEDGSNQTIGTSTAFPSITSVKTSRALLKNKRLLLRDELKYNFVTNSRIRAGVSTVFSYLDQEPDFAYNEFMTTTGGAASASGSTMHYKQKLTSLNPAFYFSYNNILSAYGGYAFLLNKDISKASSSDRSNPYAGLVFDFKQMTRSTKISRLDLSLTYADMARNNANNYWLPGIANAAQFFPSSIMSFGTSIPVFSIPNPSLANIILKNRLAAVEANAGFKNNKLLIGAAYNELRSDFIYLYNFSFGGVNSVMALRAIEKKHGVSGYVAAKLIDKQSKSWLLRFNALLSNADYDLQNNNVPSIKLKDEFQAGLQNHFTYKKWYGQVNGLMQLNDNTVNTFILNYLLVGYNFSGRKSNMMNKVSIFAHARNLLASSSSRNYYHYYSYGGAGINLTF